MRTSYIVTLTAFLLVLFARITAQSRPEAASAPKPHQQLVGATVGNIEHGRYIAEHVAMCVECHSGAMNKGTSSRLSATWVRRFRPVHPGQPTGHSMRPETEACAAMTMRWPCDC